MLYDRGRPNFQAWQGWIPWRDLVGEGLPDPADASSAEYELAFSAIPQCAKHLPASHASTLKRRCLSAFGFICPWPAPVFLKDRLGDRFADALWGTPRAAGAVMPRRDSGGPHPFVLLSEKLLGHPHQIVELVAHELLHLGQFGPMHSDAAEAEASAFVGQLKAAGVLDEIVGRWASRLEPGPESRRLLAALWGPAGQPTTPRAAGILITRGVHRAPVPGGVRV